MLAEVCAPLSALVVIIVEVVIVIIIRHRPIIIDHTGTSSRSSVRSPY